MGRWVLFLAVLPLAAADKPRKFSPEVQSLVDLAQAVPAEFGADALLRIAESGKLTDQNLKKEMIGQAFHLAARAQYPYRRRAIPGGDAYRDRAYALRLDALSLQSRAVRDLLPLDPARARELFSETLRPAIEPLHCADSLVFDGSAYYAALGSVIDRAFTPEERRKQEHMRFLFSYLFAATSPAHLAPLARTIREVKLSPAERELAAVSFSSLLERISGDDRAFRYSLSRLEQEIDQLTQVLKQQGISTSALVSATRKYLVTNLQGVRCGGDTSDAGGWFNSTIRGGVPAIDASEVKPAKIEDAVYAHAADPAAPLYAGLRKLRFGAGSSMLSEADRSSLAWRQQLGDYLNQVADWKPAQGEASTDYYHRKCAVYEELVDVTPAGSDRDKILDAYVRFIANSSIQQESGIDWFWHVDALIARSRTNTGEPAKILDALQNSGNAVLALYTSLARILPAAPAGVSVPETE